MTRRIDPSPPSALVQDDREEGEDDLLTVEMMTLSSVLGEADSSWRNVETDLVNDKDRVKLVVDMIKMENILLH